MNGDEPLLERQELPSGRGQGVETRYQRAERIERFRGFHDQY